MTLSDLKKLAQAAIDAQPSDHGLFSTVKVQIWSEALKELNTACSPEAILKLIAVVRALENIVTTYDAYRAKGVMPAPVQYKDLVIAINVGRAALENEP